MYVCYLDDSGTDRQNTILTLAGYIAKGTAWPCFEKGVEPVFKYFGVEILHARDLENTKGNFSNWSRDKKQRFVSRVCMEMVPRELLGLSFSVVKRTFEARRAESRAQRKEKYTPYTFCFHAIFDWLLKQPEICAEGVSFILEDEQQHNREAKDLFYRAKRQPKHKQREHLRTISFHAKQDSRAIQVADLFAYYSHRNVIRSEASQGKGKSPVELEPMLAIIKHYLPTDYCPVITEVYD